MQQLKQKKMILLLQISLIIIINLLLGGLYTLIPIFIKATPKSTSIAHLFSPPLGFQDGITYTTRMLYVDIDNDGDLDLIENTNYGIKNPDLIGLICFGVDWSEAYHAGQDLYRADGLSTQGAEVTAIADGIVFHVSSLSDIRYPGITVILTHTLSSGDIIYSVYMHLDETIEVSEGDVVTRGQKLGKVLYQSYSGRYPTYHPGGDDSHLHFETRTFADGRYIYTNYPACNHDDRVAGSGYTYPDHPNIFPTDEPYINPLAFINHKQYIPLVLKAHPPTPTPTPTLTATATTTPTSTPIPTSTVTPIPCIDDQDLIIDGGLEDPNLHYVWVQDDGDPVGHWPLIDNENPYEGIYGIWLGGRNDATEEIYQTVTLPNAITSATVTFMLYVTTDETQATDYDFMFFDLKNDETGDSILAHSLTYTNQFQPAAEWVHRNVPIRSVYHQAGQSIRVSLSDTTDFSNITSFYIDNISFKTHCQ